MQDNNELKQTEVSGSKLSLFCNSQKVGCTKIIFTKIETMIPTPNVKSQRRERESQRQREKK